MRVYLEIACADKTLAHDIAFRAFSIVGVSEVEVWWAPEGAPEVELLVHLKTQPADANEMPF